MNLPEWLGIGGGLAVSAIAVGNVIYQQGKKRGGDTAVTRTIDRLEGDALDIAQRRGAQDVRNESLIALSADVKKIAELTATVSALQAAHEREDQRRFDSQDDRFDRLEARMADGFAQLSGQISNVALGRIGKMYEVRTEPPPTS